MKTIEKTYDFVVCGGGIGGCLTAISASRHGLKVALVDNKTGLGGNANSDIGVTIEGASFNCFFANMREGGLVEELKERIAEIDKFGKNSLSSPVLLFWCREENVDVYSELHLHSVEMDGSRIVSVSGAQGGTERFYKFNAPQFCDATGDGTIAFLAGASFSMGREAKSEYGEIMAPLEADCGIMGASCGLRASRKEVPSKFETPSWAYHYEKESDLPHRLCTIKGKPDHGFWWIEYAGDNNDPSGDYESIRLELLKCVFGVWGYLKNDPARGMENWSMDYVSISPAKRESRRFFGDYVLTEKDIVERTEFYDAIAYAGWNIDIHVPGGFKSPLRPNVHAFFPWVFQIPLRTLYSKDVSNLWLVGRDMSVSHVALGATRLQGTIGATGHAVGIAASLLKAGESCRELSARAYGEVQQAVLKEGSFIPGFRNLDEGDYARSAEITADSELKLVFEKSEEFLSSGKGRALSFPVTEGRVEKLKLILKNEKSENSKVRLYFAESHHPNHFSHRTPLAEKEFDLKTGINELCWDLNLNGLKNGLYAVLAMGDSFSWMCSASEPYGCYTALYEPDRYFTPSKDDKTDLFAIHKAVMLTPDSEPVEWIRQVKMRLCQYGKSFDRKRVALPYIEMSPVQRPYSASQILSGVSHTDIMPDLWISDPLSPLPQSVKLTWKEKKKISSLRIVFDADTDMPQVAVDAPETLVADYQIKADEKIIDECHANKSFFRIHNFDPILTDSISLTVTKMNRNAQSARVFEIRAY